MGFMAQKFFITTAIPYTNAEPHIGHLLEFIQADVIARYQKLQGKDVFFLTGTDEHGIKIAESAEKQGVAPQQFVDAVSAKFREGADALNVEYSYFIRTTDKQKHWPNVDKIWRAMVQEGDIYKGHYTGKYCVGCEKYLVANDMDEQGSCLIHKKAPVLIDEDNYFFKLSKYQKQLRDLIESGNLKIVPEFRKAEVLSFIDQGLQDISFSRPKEKLAWGIPVPDDESQVIYVWADALTNYLSGVDYANAGATFQRFWPPDVQVVGKDIWRFHALYWPAMLMSAHLPLPKTLVIHGFLTKDGEKISKSLGNVISPIDIMQKFHVHADALRYFFLREVPPFSDGDYTDARFVERYNGDLANGVGNLTSRVAKLGSLSESGITLGANDMQDAISQAWSAYQTAMDGYLFNDALEAIQRLVSVADEYVNTHKPWALLKAGDEASLKEFENRLSSLVFVLGNIGWLLMPFMPWNSERILEIAGLGMQGQGTWQGKHIKLEPAPALFLRIQPTN